jgi:hypothetical protein
VSTEFAQAAHHENAADENPAGEWQILRVVFHTMPPPMNTKTVD